jgi:hypothetical protein
MGNYHRWHDTSKGKIQDVQEQAKTQRAQREEAKNGWGSIGMANGKAKGRGMYKFDNKHDECGGLSMFTGPVFMFYSAVFKMWVVGPVANQAPFYIAANDGAMLPEDIKAPWHAHDNVGNKFVMPTLPANWLVSASHTKHPVHPGPIQISISSSCYYQPTPPPTPAPSWSPTTPAPTLSKAIAEMTKHDAWRKRHASQHETVASMRIKLPTPVVTDPPSLAPTSTPTKVPQGEFERVQVLSEASIDGSAGYTAQSFGQKERSKFCR